MSISTTVPAPVPRQKRRLWLLAAAAVIAASSIAIGLVLAFRGGGAPVGQSVPSRTSVLASLAPKEREYVEAIMALTPAQLRGAFGTGFTSSVPTRESVMASLSPDARRYVRAVLALSPAQLRATFGTETFSSVPTRASLLPKRERSSEPGS
jgi:hypothetical protein